MNKDFMEFMRAHYNHVAQQDFKMTVVRAPTPSSTPSPGPSTPGPSAPGPSAPAGFETPTSWDATEPRLEEEVYLADNIDPAVSPEGLLYFGALPAGAHD